MEYKSKLFHRRNINKNYSIVSLTILECFGTGLKLRECCAGGCNLEVAIRGCKLNLNELTHMEREYMSNFLPLNSVKNKNNSNELRTTVKLQREKKEKSSHLDFKM